MKTCPLCHGSFSDSQKVCPKDSSPLEFIKVENMTFKKNELIDGRYKLVSLMGSGAFSEVWKCQDLHLKQFYAIKLLTFIAMDFEEIKDCVSRFFREADSASRLGHENIVEVQFFGKDINGQAYLVMEYLEGVSMTQYMDSCNCKAAIDRCVKMFIQVTKGMEAAHEVGILHRDLKPDNIFITCSTNRDVVKILDFGVAKILHDEKLAEISKDYMFGTPSYMSPEQVKGHALDGRTDIYSLGIIMFELFSGGLPFTGYTAQVLLQHITKPPPNPSEKNSKISKELSSIILKAMSKHLDNRYQSMKELGDALSKYLEN